MPEFLGSALLNDSVGATIKDSLCKLRLLGGLV
jgi:hypothetical protein